MSHRRRVTGRRRFLIGYSAIGLAIVVGAGGTSAATVIAGNERQEHQAPGRDTGISVAVPIGSVSLGPEVLDGEPVYERRVTVGGGMTIVEVSTTPFIPVSRSNAFPGAGDQIIRPDQPAAW
jgi:hypothetical protein